MKIVMRALKNKEGKRFIEGYASLFNMQSRILFENGKTFREVVRFGAFDNILGSKELNVIANIDHDMSRMLGRTASGTLELNVDNNGLRYNIEVPETQLGNDVYEQVKRGDYYESSFSFGTRDTDVEWGNDRSDGMLLRFVNNVSLLRDISIVRNGAYAKTDISAREYQEQLRSNLVVEGCKGKLCHRTASDIEVKPNIKIDEATREETVTKTVKVEAVKNTTEVKPKTVQKEQEVKVTEVVETKVEVEKPKPEVVETKTEKEVVISQKDDDYKEFIDNKYNEISNLI